MYPLWLRLTGLVVVALLCLVLGYSAYVTFKRGKPVDAPPDRRPTRPLPAVKTPAHIPTRYPRFSPVPDLSLPLLRSDEPRSPPVTMHTYQRLIDQAIKNGVLASIPVPALYLDPLLSYFAADEADGRLAVDEEALADDDRAAHLLIIPVAGTTGEHRAIR